MMRVLQMVVNMPLLINEFPDSALLVMKILVQISNYNIFVIKEMNNQIFNFTEGN